MAAKEIIHIIINSMVAIETAMPGNFGDAYTTTNRIGTGTLAGGELVHVYVFDTRSSAVRFTRYATQHIKHLYSTYGVPVRFPYLKDYASVDDIRPTVEFGYCVALKRPSIAATWLAWVLSMNKIRRTYGTCPENRVIAFEEYLNALKKGIKRWD